jgi:hypothetical protein
MVNVSQRDEMMREQITNKVAIWKAKDGAHAQDRKKTIWVRLLN